MDIQDGTLGLPRSSVPERRTGSRLTQGYRHSLTPTDQSTPLPFIITLTTQLSTIRMRVCENRKSGDGSVADRIAMNTLESGL